MAGEQRKPDRRATHTDASGAWHHGGPTPDYVRAAAFAGLLSNGIPLPTVGQDDSVAVMRCVTIYQVNRYGTPDLSYPDYETLATLAEITRRLKAATTQKFPRAKDDGTRFGPGQPVLTPLIYKAEIIAQYRQMEFDRLVEDADARAKATIVERNAQSEPARRAVGAPPGRRLAHRRAAQSVPLTVCTDRRGPYDGT